MVNGKRREVENNLKIAFESGYSNAASSLSMLTKGKINFNNLHFGFHRLDSGYLGSQGSFNNTGGATLITTEIFGDVTGKSYFVLSNNDYDLLTSEIPVSKDVKVNLKDEFIKEVDNILSASVITRLSNELKLKMYGDIPILAGKGISKIEEVIVNDFREQVDEVYINSIFFSLRDQSVYGPFFIWVIDSNIESILEAKEII